jgi:hypothetical protein
MTKAIRVLVTNLLLFGISLPLFSQTYAGRILGSVADSTGAVVGGAVVTILDVQRGITRTLTTDEAGEYVAPNLPPSFYRVRVEAKGFKSIERPNIQVEVAKDVRLDFVLKAGNVSEVVVVTEQIPLVETTNATLGGTLSNKTINDLPLNGRNYQNLLTLRPGVMIYPGGGGWTQSTNGLRPEDNLYMIDGLDNDEPFSALSVINGAAIAGDAATILPIDAIQEFNTEENPPAEFGWKPGAIVNVGLKSGTNQLHGTAYAFGRSDSFDARNYFNPGPQAPLNVEQFGATVGGAIKKDKFFYFVGYEGQRYTLGNAFVVNVPETIPQATPDPANSFPDAGADLLAHGVPLSALSLHLAGCTLPAPPAPQVPTCTGGLYGTNASNTTNLPLGFPNANRSDNGLVKLDYHINDRNALSGMYFIGDDSLTDEDAPYLQPQWSSLAIQRAQTAGASWVWTPNSRWVNEARFGYVHVNVANSVLDNNVPATSYGINTGVTNPVLNGMPQIIVAGFTQLGGSSSWPKIEGPNQTFQFIDHISYLRGKHALKFGGELRHGIVNQASYKKARGQITFAGGGAFSTSTPLEDFLAGEPNIANLLIGNPQRHLTQWGYAGFIQDDWRIRPTVTLNLGLRYEYTTPPKEANNLLGNFDPAISPTLGMVQVGKQVSSPFNGDHTNFAPRLGVAWDVNGKGTTVVRAGGSIIYSTLSMNVFIAQEDTQNATTLGLAAIPTGATIVLPNGTTEPGGGTIAVSSITLNGGPGSPLVFGWQNNGPNVPLLPATTVTCGNGVGTNPVPCNILGIDRKFRTPYVGTWTVGVQHEFTKDLSLEVDYVGNHGADLTGIRDLNQPPLGGGPGPYTAQFPFLGFINFLSNLYRSNYNGLQATLTQRIWHGLSFTAGYTYSHALDDSSFNNNQFLPQDSTHPDKEYASGDYDIKHRFTLSLTYAIPGRKSFAQMLEGWEINSIVTLQSGQPWIANDTANNISGTGEFADRWDFFGNPSDFTSNQNPLPYCTGPLPGNCTQNISNAANPKVFSDQQTIAMWNMCSSHPNTTTQFGCYVQGNSVMVAPALGNFGNMGRNIFRDSGFRDWDLSVTKDWKFKEVLTAQFRAEFFNVLNHPSFANPYGALSGFGPGATADPSAPGVFGCGCATPDQAGGNPVFGSGSNRAIQLGLKLIF